MRALMKIITEKGEGASQTFLSILKQHQARYQQLPQLFTPNTQGAPPPTVFTAGNSVVSTREITNIKGKSLNKRIEIVSGPGSSQSGNVAGQVPQADFTALDNSVICADTICNSTFDGDVDLSVTLKSSHVRSGTVEETVTPPSSQDPAVKTLRKHKVELIDCLRADHSFILQHVDAKDIVTGSQYQNLMSIPTPGETVTKLIDQIINKGPKSCSQFIAILKDPELHGTYPQLKEITEHWC
ncbi:uncharacterized protein AKAME5_001329000 [Lates japonicus]|uniref:CARD domain-containing protein n=1 Tax=Lates japonicus TaxID=270547 RepID=A0AAD3MUQ2_LATJO|nr:uncharacterized protein AKAME5_001329000 [Lates japonicus]